VTELERLLPTVNDPVAMLVYADALEDSGDDSLARAYRWAAKHGKWPFERRKLQREGQGMAYDWDGEHRESVVSSGRVPAHALLPRHLYDGIRSLPDKTYGGVREAFVLLARVLTGADKEGDPQ
jgi:hypothetical protein